MIKRITTIGLMCALVMSAGCSLFDSEHGYIRDRTADYKPGYSLPPIKTPPGIDSIHTDPYYTIPELKSDKPAKASLYPPKSATLANAKAIKNSNTEQKEVESK